MIPSLEKTISGAIQHLRETYASLQAGQASAAMVDEIQVENYGTMMPIKSVATVSCPDPKTIRIEPWDKSAISAIEKAIQIADIGIAPTNMGTHILLPIPPMTEDRRKKLVKIVHEESESAKIGVRNSRQDVMKKIKADADLSEDEKKNLEKEVQNVVDTANKDIESMTKSKENDVMTV